MISVNFFSNRDKREISTESTYDYDYAKFRKEYYAENPRDLSENSLDVSGASTKKIVEKRPTKKPKIATMENYCSSFLYVRTRVCRLHFVVSSNSKFIVEFEAKPF